MTKLKIVPLSLLAIFLAVTGCNDDFLNTKPLVQVPSEDVWKDAGLAEAFVTDIYNGFGNGGFDEQMLASLTDEAIFTHPGRGINTITEARSNPADRGWINNTLDWPNMYIRIRATNLALENLQTVEFDNPALVTRLQGEAHFMRAYFYHQLVRYFGGVPLVDRSYTLGEPDYMAPRNSFEECINFIVKDCDAAAQLLKGQTLANGRATEASALALKSRILLYAASDLHHLPTATQNAPDQGAFAQKELLGYPGGDRSARWQAAKAAAKAVLDLPGLGYQADLASPVEFEQGTANYVNLSMARNGGERDLILGRYFIDAKNEGGAFVGRNNGPNGYHNWAGNTPLQNLVDDYEMMDGTRFSWSNPEHTSAPYADRDPRFYATILYDGAPWKPRTADVISKDPVMTSEGMVQFRKGQFEMIKGVGQIQTGQYQIVGANGQVIPYFGLDTRQSSVEDWNGSRTGYYMRKFVDPSPAIVDQNTRQQVPWPLFRYTEAMLNYAEACLELGETDEALTWLNRIRFRAGMPALSAADDLKQRYRNERRVELAYEEHRFHDVRRWMIARQTLGQPARRINIIGTLKPGKDVKIYKYDPTSYDYRYEPLNIDPGIENRAWSDKMYYLPIHRDEINRNTKLVQNPGY